MLFKDHFKKQFDNSVLKCEACELKKSSGPVLGYGDLEPDVMFIGDVAKESDLATGVPFTGIAKERMTEVIKATELKRGDYYLTYLIKHTLPGKMKIDSLSKQPCLELLIKEIEMINPRIICSMGYFVTKYLLKEYAMKVQHDSMNDLHGNGYIVPARTFYHSKYLRKKEPRPKRYLIPTWSPAVDNPLMNKQMMDDIKTIKAVRSLYPLLFDWKNTA